MSKSGTAAVLSLILPGVGQIYDGTMWRGSFWFVVTPGLWIGSGGLLGWVAHFASPWTAHRYAERRA